LSGASKKMSDLFYINKSKPTNEKVEEFYTVLGKQDFLVDKFPMVNSEQNALAKKIINTTNNTSRFFIKVGTYGRPYNPIGMYSEGQSNKFLAKAGKPEYSFKEVNEKTFSFYVNFLSTKNTAWLSNTERELQ
jgi:hypothetical protein